jgi:hypothetical protein
MGFSELGEQKGPFLLEIRYTAKSVVCGQPADK